MRKRTLVALECERVSLELDIEDLTTVINKAHSLSESSVHIPRLIKFRSRLAVVKVDITCVKKEVAKLEKTYSNRKVIK